MKKTKFIVIVLIASVVMLNIHNIIYNSNVTDDKLIGLVNNVTPRIFGTADSFTFIEDGDATGLIVVALVVLAVVAYTVTRYESDQSGGSRDDITMSDVLMNEL